MKAIGGYFELELGKGEVFHHNAIHLNTARNAFEYILLAYKFNKVYLPYFSCDVLLEPLQKHNLEVVFYSIDECLQPKFDYSILKHDEAFLYINYFGLKDQFISSLVSIVNNLIIDNSQSYFSKPIFTIPTFYSCRKFFGVPDGAHLYIEKTIDYEIENDISIDRCNHLLERIDYSAEKGYANYVSNENKLHNQPIKKMSSLTASILSSIDYTACMSARKENFKMLHNDLKPSNKLVFDIENETIPMIYPYWGQNKKLRQDLLDNRIYSPTYWPNVKEWCTDSTLEYKLAEEVVYIPIDHRYGSEDINRILNFIK
jgi:hypothetical protein